jgi:hypothetical protein
MAGLATLVAVEVAELTAVLFLDLQILEQEPLAEMLLISRG